MCETKTSMMEMAASGNKPSSMVDVESANGPNWASNLHKSSERTGNEDVANNEGLRYPGVATPPSWSVQAPSAGHESPILIAPALIASAIEPPRTVATSTTITADVELQIHASIPQEFSILQSTTLGNLDSVAAGLLPSPTPPSSAPSVQHEDVEEEEGDMDPRYFDVDSAYAGDSMRGEDTVTLASFITNYRWENGRRYHAYSDGAYWGPNDESANDQQDLAHHLYKLTLDGRLHLAPLNAPHNILDLGTGTGIWAIEMADLYPSAHVIGTDLSPIQPNFVPPNCSFEIEDVNMEWTYPASTFDYIHIRELFGSIADWDLFFAQTYQATKPGGYVEILEHSVTPVSEDGSVGPDSFYTLWGTTVIAMGDRQGKSFEIWSESKKRMESAGFVDVVEARYKWPMNAWSREPKMRELGAWNQLRLYDGVEGFMIRLLTVTGGWSYERAQMFLAEMRNNLRDFSIHAYLDVSVVYGRKP